MQGVAQRFALPALGRGRRSRPARKKLRRRKLLEIAPESPASGARFVRQPAYLPERWQKKTTPLTHPIFTHNLNFGYQSDYLPIFFFISKTCPIASDILA